MITPDISRKIEAMLKTEGYTADKIIDQLLMLFGESKKFWEGFSIQLLSDIIMYFADISKKK